MALALSYEKYKKEMLKSKIWCFYVKYNKFFRLYIKKLKKVELDEFENLICG